MCDRFAFSARMLWKAFDELEKVNVGDVKIMGHSPRKAAGTEDIWAKECCRQQSYRTRISLTLWTC